MNGKLSKLKDSTGNYIIPITHPNAIIDENGKTLTQKLSEIPSDYTLPQASSSVLGGVKIGSGLSIDQSGVLSSLGGTGSTEHYKGLLVDYVGTGGVFDNNAYIKTTLDSGIYRVSETNKPPVMNPPLSEDFVIHHQKMFTTSNWAFQTAYAFNNPNLVYVRKVLCGSPYTDGRQGTWKFIGGNEQYTFASNKKLLTMGDSITAKWGGSVNYPTTQPSTFPVDNNGYQPHIEKRLGVQVYSVAYGGAKMTRVVSHEPFDSHSFHYLATTMDFTSYDYVTVAYGTNDAGWRLPLGTIDSNDPYTLMGAMNVGIQAIYSNKPSIQLFFITPILRADHTSPNTTDQQDYDLVKSYGDAIKQVCAKYDIPIFDGLVQSGINKYNYPTTLDADKLHVNSNGYQLYGARIAEWLKQYI